MDYRFAIQCWQDQAGDENAKANVFVDGVQVATEVEITATSADSPQLITWESTGLDDIAADASVVIKVVLVNEYYVDASTDRNIWINQMGYIDKADGTNYKRALYEIQAGEKQVASYENITDFTVYERYASPLPTAVTGDQIISNFWDDAIANNAFYNIPVWGGSAEGVSITLPLNQSVLAQRSNYDSVPNSEPA